MKTQDEHDLEGTMSLKDMQDWLKHEVRDSTKAHDLRIRDAKLIVDDYEAGKITAEEVDDRLYQHDKRWGESLFGATASPELPDEAILKRIDQAREQSIRGFQDDLIDETRQHKSRVR